MADKLAAIRACLVWGIFMISVVDGALIAWGMVNSGVFLTLTCLFLCGIATSLEFLEVK